MSISEMLAMQSGYAFDAACADPVRSAKAVVAVSVSAVRLME